MSRTWLSVITALVLTSVSAGIFLARRSALGPESAGPLGWKVSLTVEGRLLAKDASISVTRPLDFRRQHISEERFQSGKELREPTKWKRFGQRKHTWRRQANRSGAELFRLEYSFVCSFQRPTGVMERSTAQIDGPPAAGQFLKSTPRIQAKDEQIARAAKKAADGLAPREQAQALFEFVSALAAKSAPEGPTALACLQDGGGDALGKARLLVALCRSRGLPTRLIDGLVLARSGRQQPHFWAEAWTGEQWLPMDPQRGRIGPDFPENYLVLRMGDAPVVVGRGAKLQYAFTAQGRNDEDAEADFSPSPAKSFWRKVSFYSLHVSEQHLVEFLLLLPLGALIASVTRTLIGIPTFGIFGPALIGLAFHDLKVLPWGLPVFLLTVLIGWAIRHLLERYQLLQVPRVSAMLTLIVIFLLAMILTANNFGITTSRYISLFPLVIMTFVVERFWTIEEEDSAAASFITLLGTVAVAVTVSLALAPQAVGTWMLRYPETLGLVLAAQFLLGRYTGYRLTELYRFGDLIKEHAEGPS
jgi:transglutaminase-like putative cysteine protease